MARLRRASWPEPAAGADRSQANVKATSRGNVAWHGLHAGEAVRLLGTDLENGLSESEATARLARFGPKVTRRSGPPEWKRFPLQFHAPLVYILLAAAGITAWLGEWIDSSVIFGVVFTNAIIGYIQESKAEHAIEALTADFDRDHRAPGRTAPTNSVAATRPRRHRADRIG